MSETKFNRREFAWKMALGAGAASLPISRSDASINVQTKTSGPGRIRFSLNAYSFDKPLRAGTMTLDDLLEYCAEKGFEGVDLTGYYFPGYPVVPADEYIYHIRQKAFRLGIELGCTGVRNDFTWADPEKRKAEKKLVNDWILVAHKLGAPGVRIFAGNLSRENFSWAERAEWIADDIRECAEYGKNNGVMLALQNHNDFLKTSSEVDKMLTLINSDWVGLMLDIGSYHTGDPYKDISINSKHAITWQIKEKVFVNDVQVDTDFKKILEIVRQCGYKGYLPLETLGEGDPYKKVEILLNKVRSEASLMS